jgi:hypothetical protein
MAKDEGHLSPVAVLLFSLVLTGSLGGCAVGAPAAPVQPTPSTSANPNLILTVLNASREKASVDIQVFIDGKPVLEDNLTNSNPAMPSIPPRRMVELELAPGVHKLKAVSQAGAASLEQDFTISGKHWALLGYEYWSGTGTPTAPGHFAFEYQNKPILFQ